MRHALHTFIDACSDAGGRLAEKAAVAAEHVQELAARGLQHIHGWLRHEPLPRRPLVAMAVAVITGCAIGPGVAGLGPPGCAQAATLGCWLAAAGAFVVWALVLRSGREATAAAALLVAIGCTAAGWAIARERLFCADDLAWSLAERVQPVVIEGIVVESPRRLTLPAMSPSGGPAIEPSSECVVAVTKVRRGAAWKPASGRAAVIVAGEPPDVISGCRVRVFGRGLRPGHALNPGEFDFRERAQSLRCLSIVRCQSPGCLSVIDCPAAWSLSAWLDRVRMGGAATLGRHCGVRAGLAAALLLGSREALPTDDTQKYMVTGTIHILSISGLHVGILAYGLFKVLGFAAVRRSRAILAVAVCTGLYMLLVGAETPVVRATLLVWLSCLGAALGRSSPAINALAAAAIVVLIVSPADVFRIGPQLSFLSTAVLVGSGALVPPLGPGDDPIERLIAGSRSPLERRLRRLGRQALAVVITSTAVWVVTAPIVAERFHVVSPIGLVLNPLVAPLVPLAMAWGFACLVVAPFSEWLAGICGAACDVTLGCVDWMTESAAAIPAGHAWVVGPPGWWVAGAYGGLVALLVALPRARLARPATWALAAVVWIGVGLFATRVASLVRPAAMPLEATAAALGHGCGIVVRSPQGRVLVYDAGRLGAPGAARRAMSAVLWSGGHARIDTLVISHADTDHFNAVPDLLERFDVGELVVSKSFLVSDAFAARDLLRQVYERRIPVRCVRAGDDIPYDPLCRVRVLHHDASAADDNQTSLVLSVESAGRRLLLTGDLEGDALDAFVAGDPDTCDVLLAPHHGSATSLPAEIARSTKPDWVVVSGPGGSRWPEVRDAYETASGAGRPARVVKTGGPDAGSGARGAVAVSLSAAGVTVRQFSAGRWRDVPPPFRPWRSSPGASAMRPPPGGRS
jgi:competence protein ComEC